MDWKSMKKHPGKHIKEAEKIDTICEVLLKKFILEKMPLEKALVETCSAQPVYQSLWRLR